MSVTWQKCQVCSSLDHYSQNTGDFCTPNLNWTCPLCLFLCFFWLQQLSSVCLIRCQFSLGSTQLFEENSFLFKIICKCIVSVVHATTKYSTYASTSGFHVILFINLLAHGYFFIPGKRESQQAVINAICCQLGPDKFYWKYSLSAWLHFSTWNMPDVMTIISSYLIPRAARTFLS